jgi:hypothetical protein
MRSPFSWCGLCLLLTTAYSLAADKPNPKDKDAPQAAEKDKLIRLGSVAGVVEGSPGEDGLLKIKVTIRYLEPNLRAQADLLKDEQHLMARQQAALTIRNPIQRQQEFLRILQSAQNMGRANLFNVKEVKKDVEFETTDDTKYRTAEPPTAFDDKGNPKTYTKAELKELKGQDNLPGYPAERDAVRGGVTVIVSAARKRPAPGEKPLVDEKALATRVVIVGDK